jgi:TPR repeat protein
LRKLFFRIFACIAVIAAALPPAAFADTAGDAYQRGQIAWKNQDYETAFREYRTAGDLGHLDAQILLAINLSASPYREDFTESRKWWAKAAGQGNSSSMVALGDSYRHGDLDGNFVDYKEAVKWYRTASNSKNTEHRGDASLALGEMYEAGQGTAANPSEAMKFYKKAADCGNGEAKFRIGLLYETGKGVGRNYAKAREWYTAAAGDRVSAAMYRVGYLHEKGLGVKANMKEAEKWYRKAADAGDSWSQLYFGDKCEHGRGVPVDLISAHVWYNLASKGMGSEELWKKAKSAKERVALTLSAEDLARAEKMAREWRPR